jgi:hypothetical protein
MEIFLAHREYAKEFAQCINLDQFVVIVFVGKNLVLLEYTDTSAKTQPEMEQSGMIDSSTCLNISTLLLESSVIKKEKTTTNEAKTLIPILVGAPSYQTTSRAHQASREQEGTQH